MKPNGTAIAAGLLILCFGACGIVAAQSLAVEEPGTVSAGEPITISGTTNLAPGNQLLVSVIPTEFLPLEQNQTTEPAGISGTVTVEPGEPANTWSFTINPGQLEPGNYLVTVEWIEGDATATTTLFVEAAGPSPTVTTATPTPTTNATTATPSPTPTEAAPTVPVLAVLTAILAAALLLRR
ncbi:hypothetical protein FGU65_08420 [Methanoculleus sp. FWC-SCC1]|uniref:PGF-CTERM sorting domain-containing protein n=1 Tax=Methanoculleus frigidifontis TaxID=2584085 RepID=A0ABT8MAF0_9EURY|nr:hypothetical protein [Methanoculleus sp. FWC-SCC1]MDN7024911.1 hypothetical protein [Methanoculleus sp. FWC-SCC1]